MRTRIGLLLGILVLASRDVALSQAVRESPVVVMVNEVLASNGHVIPDPQWQYEDWVELCNPGRSAVDLGGYYLTDDLTRPTKWQIPPGNPAATTIGAHGYLLIWADGDIADSGLHAAFRLSGEGEQIGLFAPDGLTMIDSLSFGPQQMDVSYGRYPDGGMDLRLQTVPTPGMANLVVHEGVVATPRIDLKSRVCTSPITVTLTCETEGALIYFTVDGSEPFSVARQYPVGAAYTTPLMIGGTMTLKAVAWKPGWRQSEVASERYVFIARELQGFSSPLAIGIVDTFRKGVSFTSVASYGCFIDLGEGDRAFIQGPIDFAGPAGINVRGKSSAGFPKKQYHFEAQDDQGNDKDVSILGLPAESDWVLQGPYSDKSLMRNVLSYRWANEMGRYAPRTRFIELFLNTNDSVVSMADYVGVYVLMEKIKIGPSRVDIARLEPSDDVEPEITGGYLLKKDKSKEQAGTDLEDQSFRTNRGLNLIYDDPTGEELTPAQETWIRNFMNSFEATLYGSNFKDPANGYARFIDVGSFIDLHILVELTKNIDGFRLSTYMYKDRGGKLNMGPAWDYNLSLGNADYLNGWIPTGWYFSQLGEGDYPYWRRLFEDPEFRLGYADRWFALRRDVLATGRLIGVIEDYATLLDEPAARNFDRWRILGVDIWPNPADKDPTYRAITTFAGEVAWMQKWLTDRLAWMDGQIATEFAPAPPVFNRQGGDVEPGLLLTMTGPGTIYYTTDGTDPKAVAGGAAASGVVLVPENASKRVLVPAGPVGNAWRGGVAFDDSAWTLAVGNPGGVGFERTTGYESFFSFDTGPQMYDRQASCYIRIPFQSSGYSWRLTSLMLKVRYDDGFVAYLKGVEIARRNFTGEPTWNSTAGVIHDDGDAVSFESIDVTSFLSALQRGENVLAVQAMNSSTTSSDFLFSVELAANQTLDSQTGSSVRVYAGPVPLTASTQIKARSLNAGRWSAVNDTVFSVGPVAGSLRISEILYHPAEAGDPNDPNTEYVELTNVGAEAINLNLVRFADGIDFLFPSYPLPPAGYCLVVKDATAFQAKYGPGLPVVGQYAGSLDNAGEQIELRDASGRAIQSFSYRDNWYSSTDGEGFSLVVVDPSAADPNALNDRAAWRPSTHPGGSPGTDN